MKKSRDHAREIVLTMYNCMKAQDDRPFQEVMSRVLTDLVKHEVIENRDKQKVKNDKIIRHIFTEQRKKYQAIMRYVSKSGKPNVLKMSDFDNGVKEIWGEDFYSWYEERVVSLFPAEPLPAEVAEAENV